MWAFLTLTRTFLSTLSLRRATNTTKLEYNPIEFLSTLSLRRATAACIYFTSFSLNFYPRSPCGERLDSGIALIPHQHFYPRSPCGERLYVSYNQYNNTNHFYPRSPCGERPGSVNINPPSLIISIHALLAESDLFRQNYECFQWIFLSTLSLRRATMFVNLRVVDGSISIHALLAESDMLSMGAILTWKAFLSTLSLRRATTWQRGSRITYVEFLSTLSLRRATAKVHKTVGHFCAYETNFMEIASSC